MMEVLVYFDDLSHVRKGNTTNIVRAVLSQGIIEYVINAGGCMTTFLL